MKITMIFWLAVFIACLSTCKKNILPIDSPIDPIDTIVSPPIDSHIIEAGKLSVLKNGVAWNIPFKAGFFHSKYAFGILGSTTYSNGVRLTFNIDDIPCKEGIYPFEFWPSQAALYPNQIPQSAFIWMYDGDQPIGDFLLDTLRHDHFIQVLKYDTLTNIVEGRFQIFTKNDHSHSWQPSGITIPDTISMTEGKFRLEVKHF